MAADGTEVVGAKAAPVVPAEIHGFTVDRFMGPYPLDAKGTHRRAMYVVLRPCTAKTRERMAYRGRDAIRACTPLTPEFAAHIEAHPQGKSAEIAVRDTLRAAALLAAPLNT